MEDDLQSLPFGPDGRGFASSQRFAEAFDLPHNLVIRGIRGLLATEPSLDRHFIEGVDPETGPGFKMNWRGYHVLVSMTERADAEEAVNSEVILAKLDDLEEFERLYDSASLQLVIAGYIDRINELQGEGEPRLSNVVPEAFDGNIEVLHALLFGYVQKVIALEGSSPEGGMGV